MDNRSTHSHHAMIGVPSTFRQGQQRQQPPGADEAIYQSFMQEAAAGLPSSTIPSAAHSTVPSAAHSHLEQHPSAPTLDNASFGVFEPQTGRPYSSFAPLTERPTRPQQQQQVPGDFVPGAGGGTAEYYARTQSQPPHRQTTRTNTNYSDRSGSSANLSPSRQEGYTYPNPAAAGYPTGTVFYPPNNGFEYSSGSDAFASSDQYTSPAAMSPEKYMSSPEQMPLQQGVFSGGNNNVFGGPSPTGYVGQNTGVFGQRPSVSSSSPTRPIASPTRANRANQGGGSGGFGWQAVDPTVAAPSAPLVPSHNGSGGIVSTGSGGSHSSGGGGGGSAGPYAASHSSGGYSSGQPQARNVPRQGPIGRSHSIGGGSRPGHLHSQSQSGHLAPPTTARRPTKRQHQEEPEDDDSEGEDDQPVVTGRAGQRAGKPRLPGACSHCKRLKMKCVFENGADICQRCQHTNKTCIVEGRKPRSGPNKRELLMRELASKDQLIDSLLRQIHNPAMRAPINWPPSVPVPQPNNAQERPPDKDVLAWIESIRQNRPPTPTGSIDASTAHRRAHSEPLPVQPEPDDDAVSFGESASNIKDKNEERPRTPAAELRQDSADLDDKLHSIPPSAAPVGLIAKLALTAGREKRGSDAGMTGDAEEEDKWVGIGNATYFEAGPSADPELRRIIIERQMPPEILTHGIIKPAEVELLFRIFFDQLNPFVAILDPHMHTPAFVFGRCPFLFTAICAISSRYYTKRPELYTIAMHFAKQSAATALIDGWKSVELVQAYILMSVYPVPARRWEEDRTWLYLGLAIRMATDLNLHLPWQGKATGEAHEREILNRTRTWMICFNLDRSGATQFGRPPTIREDYIIRKSQDWYKRSNFNLPLDVHLTAYTRLLRIVARFLAQVYSDSNTPTALNKNLDFLMHCTTADKELVEFEHETKELFEKESDHNDSACEYRCHLLPFLSNYSRLVIFSFGHQQAFQRGLDQGKIFFDKCYKAASEVVRIATDILAPSGRLKYAPDGHFVFISFAAAFLLKMLRPQFAAACEPAQSTRIIQQVTRLTEVLASNEVAIDDRHSPRLYSRFLSGLIVKHTQGGMVLAKPAASGTGGGAGAAGAAGGAAGGKGVAGKGPATNQTANNGATSSAGLGKSAAATDAGMVHESPPSAPVALPSEGTSQQGRMSSPIARIRSPPIVIRAPTMEQSMHDAGQNGLSPQATHGRSPSGDQPANIMGGYVTVDPSGDMSSMASTTQGETTITDASDADMDYTNDEHDMLAAMYAIQDPTWWNSSLLPGFNANFADDGSNSSNEMRNWYATHGNLAANGNAMGGMNMQMMNNVPNLFAPGLDFTQGVDMNQNGLGVDHMMAGYGYQ